MSAMNAVQLLGAPLMPAFLKRSLLYQKPTTPRLYGMPYCFPFTCQPAAAPPIVLIHGFTYFVRSATFLALTCSASSPQPHCWKTSGGLLDCRAIGIFVFCSASFWIGTFLTVTFGWSLWNSFATWSNSALPGPAPGTALFHQTSVTFFFFCGAATPAELATTVASTANAAASRTTLRSFIELFLLRGVRPPDRSPLFAESALAAHPAARNRFCQPLSISVSICVMMRPARC